MNLASVLLLCLSCSALSAETTLACDMKAIPAAERPRHADIARKLKASIREVRDLSDGYTLRLAETGISLTEAAEWVRLERLCCPFLSFRIEVAGPASGFDLTLRGPAGAKAILEAELRK